MKLVVLNAGGKTRTLWQTDKEIVVNKETTSYPIFGVKDVNLIKEKLTVNGVKVDNIIMDDHKKYFTFYDPGGNIFEVCEPLNHK
ncbi:MAG TPA: hypothetical protein ENN33_00695 [Ignavibacteria bacterium]|nr:hypothetical protein [Ignavibacteria bacterium]